MTVTLAAAVRPPALVAVAVSSCVPGVSLAVIDEPFVWIWNWLPPLNSMPQLKPRSTKLKMQMTMMISEARYQRRRLPMKSNRVSPRYRR